MFQNTFKFNIDSENKYVEFYSKVLLNNATDITSWLLKATWIISTILTTFLSI